MCFEFFQLPREIRDQIYLFLCGYNKIKSVRDWKKGLKVVKMSSGPPEHWESPSWKNTASQLQQLQVSSQFYKEAATILYSSSRFDFGEPKSVAHFLSGLHPKFQSRIRLLHLTISASQPDLQLWRKLFKEYAVTRFPSLRVIRIDVRDAKERDMAKLPEVRFYSSKSLPMLEHATVVFHRINIEPLYWGEGSFVSHHREIIFQEISEWLT